MPNVIFVNQTLQYTHKMKRFTSLFILALVCICTHAQSQQRYVGGDISMLPKYEQYNSAYKDAYGKKIDNLLTWFISDCGWNTFRVRIFVNPIKKAQGKTDPSVCQDLAYVTALGTRIKAAGAYFMLDFHYSDEWVDALNIQAPVAWQGASDDVMADSVAVYTHTVLQTLKAAGATPDLVQVGNEIMYGLCGITVRPYDKAGDNWDGYLGLLRAGCNAVREECPNAQIIIHTDRPNEVTNTKYYYNKLIDNNVDFDVIGLSYYPFWHGYLNTTGTNLVSSLNAYAAEFPNKRLQIVECAYNFQWWPNSGVNYDTRSIWPCSVTGQYNFVRDLIDALKPLPQVDGISYWFPEEAGNGDKGEVIPSWLNRGFWNEDKSTSGHAINRTGQVTDGKTAADVCAPYYMGRFLWGGQNLENLPTETQASKHLRNGQLFIERNNLCFSVEGKQL